MRGRKIKPWRHQWSLTHSHFTPVILYFYSRKKSSRHSSATASTRVRWLQRSPGCQNCRFQLLLESNRGLDLWVPSPGYWAIKYSGVCFPSSHFSQRTSGVSGSPPCRPWRRHLAGGTPAPQDSTERRQQKLRGSSSITEVVGSHQEVDDTKVGGEQMSLRVPA